MLAVDLEKRSVLMKILLPRDTEKKVYDFANGLAPDFHLASHPFITLDPENGSRSLIVELEYAGSSDRQHAREIMTRTALPLRAVVQREAQIKFYPYSHIAQFSQNNKTIYPI